MFQLSGVARSAWRITVRQLESMIRLSEGMARLYCQDEVSGVVTENIQMLSLEVIGNSEVVGVSVSKLFKGTF